MKKQRYVLSSTHLDSQGFMMTQSALESGLKSLNGPRKVRLGLEHIRTFPPFGVIMNGEVFQGEDQHHYLVADFVYFDKQEILVTEDGTELVRESFGEGEFPFIECAEEEVSKIVISTDPANFEGNFSEISELNSIVAKESELEFEEQFIGRKSALPDPETIIKISSSIAIALGLYKSTILAPLKEAVGADIAKFYKLISSLAVETIKRVKPENRPKSFVVSYPNSEINIELVVTTHKADRVLEALEKVKLEPIEKKIVQLASLNPEKIQFVYNEFGVWEFNYLMSKNGSVVGTKKSFSKRNQLYNQILRSQNGE